MDLLFLAHQPAADAIELRRSATPPRGKTILNITREQGEELAIMRPYP